MTAPELNKRLYSERFNDFYRALCRHRIKKILSMVDENSGTFLDVGCGDGWIAENIAKETGMKPYGLELIESNVKKCKKAGVNARACDLNSARFPYKDNSFDFVLCSEVIEHVVNTEKLLGEIHRVLKPGKSAIITAPNIACWYNRFLLLTGFMPHWIESGNENSYNMPWGIVSGHVRAFTRGALTEMVRDAGFEVEKVRGTRLSLRGQHESGFQRAVIPFFTIVDSAFTKIPQFSTMIMVKARKPQ
ncbi:MAG: methyltransferase domain-containing protein [Candidatus Diapherotrites archaeon]|nr:methyltransferase domain-containing protein [Candidatus Micrarchaeota archaeon]MBU1939687.1 methyltransferase domain-containing protein [Candidatus Micrarchaeota archaeon]